MITASQSETKQDEPHKVLDRRLAACVSSLLVCYWPSAAQLDCSAYSMLKAPAVPGLPTSRLHRRQRPERLMWRCRRQLTAPRRLHTCLASATEHTAAAAVPMERAEVQPIADTQLPSAPGVYAVYDVQNKLQYIGISRRVG